VFDFDGIILDSETPEFESHRRIYEQCGAELTREEWCDQIGLFSDGSRHGGTASVRARRVRSIATPSTARDGASSWSSCRANRCGASATS
jgi:beta-phosphoglucomutase-like phosphatase (HAD superfamily)